MKLINPHYIHSSPMDTFKEQIESYFLQNKTVRAVSFDQLRSFFKKTKAQWGDGEIHQKLIEWGYVVEVSE